MSSNGSRSYKAMALAGVLALGLVGATHVGASTHAPPAAGSVRQIGSCQIVVHPSPQHHTECPLANLRNADLQLASLGGANLAYADLSHADLAGANLAYANLSHADLSWADLSEANLAHAELSPAELAMANLSFANLSYAAITGANFTFADTAHANLTGTAYTAATWNNSTCPDGSNSNSATSAGAPTPRAATASPVALCT